MKVKSSLIVPVFAASMLVPTVGNAMVISRFETFKTSGFT